MSKAYAVAIIMNVSALLYNLICLWAFGVSSLTTFLIGINISFIVMLVSVWHWTR